jgi:transcriptional regulator with XRE-family HTH domain
MLLAKILRDARKQSGDTLDKVCQRIEISNTYLSDLETGKAIRPKLSIISSLADYYGIDKDVLIVSSGKIPQDVYFKIVNNPQLLSVVRNFKL